MPSSRQSKTQSSPQPRRKFDSNSPHFMLDPYGIYGTRTANRRAAALRRRRLQTAILVLGVIALIAGSYYAVKIRRTAAKSPSSQLDLSMAAVSPPVWLPPRKKQPGTLLIAGESGRLSSLAAPPSPERDWSKVRPKILLQTDFPLGAPRVSGDHAFVPCENGFLYALNWKTGRVVWKHHFGASLTAKPALMTLASTHPQPTAPTPDAVTPNGEIKTPSTPSPSPRSTVQKIEKRLAVVAGDDNGLVMAIDVGSGRVLWRSRVPAPCGDGLTTTVLNGKPLIFVPLLGGSAMRGGLWCLDGATGKTRWQFPSDPRVEGIQVASVAVSQRFVFGVNDTGVAYSLQAGSGAYNPKKKIGWKVFAQPFSEESAKKIVVLRAAPVIVPTRAVDGDEPMSENRRPAVLVTGGEDGGVRAYNAWTGVLRWRYRMNFPIVSLTPLSNGKVLACSRGRYMVVIDAGSGNVRLRFVSKSGNLSGAAVTEGAILGLTRRGTVLQWPIEDGDLE